MRAAGTLVAGAWLSACGISGEDGQAAAPSSSPGAVGADADELGDALTSYDAVTNYNNYYEFTTDKEGVAGLARRTSRPRPGRSRSAGWSTSRKTYAIEDILKRFPQEERIYRLRCVEGWSMVIPWLGFPLAKLLDEVEPTSQRQVRALRDGRCGPRRCPARASS